MTEAAQEQEMAFWDMWQKSQRSSINTEGSTAAGTEAPNQEDGASQHPDATPPKYAKPASKGAGKGKRSTEKAGGSNQTWHDKSSWSWQGSGGSSGGRIQALENQAQCLTRLALRPEDAQKDPSKLTGPLRVALLGCLFRELQRRMEQFLQGEKMRQTWINMEWLSQDAGFFPYLKYNQETKRHEPEKMRPGLPTPVLREHISEVAKNIPAQGALARHHPLRPLTETMAGESLVFLFQTGIGSDAAQSLSLHLRTLIGHSVTQLCSFSIQADKIQRSGLAMQISEKNLQ